LMAFTDWEPMDSADLAEVIGRKIQLEIMLNWDLKIPEATISRMLNADRDEIKYLVDLDSPITFEPHRKGSPYSPYSSLPKMIE